MPTFKKRNLPVWEVRQLLEPGPVVLVSSSYKGKNNIMTMGWHTVMEFTPSLIGCIISNQNHSFNMIQRSKQCVINIPTLEIAQKVAQIGSCSGREVDKFSEFQLTPLKASKIQAPLIKECYANIECEITDTRLIKKYNFFIFKVLKIHKATTPRYPKTIHYMGDGAFMTAGKIIHLPTLDS